MTDAQRQKRCERADLRILFHLPFFAPGACRLPVEFSTEVPKACTDGKRIVINPEWMDTITDDNVVTVKCHEILHPSLGHLWRMPTGGDHQLWNEACDYVVNGILKEFSQACVAKGMPDPFPFPPGDYCYNPAFAGKCEEEIYHILAGMKPPGGGKQQQQQQGQQGQSGQGKQGKQGQPGQPGQGKQQSQPGQGQPGGNVPGQFGQFVVKPDTGKESKQDKTSWQHTMIQAAAAAKGRGKLPLGVGRTLDRTLDPGVPWYEMVNRWLREKAHDDWNWSKPNQYYTGDLMLPVMESERIGYMVTATDTSGSINRDALSRFQASKQTALDDLKPRKLIDIYCDAQIHKVAEYRPGDEIPKSAPGGGGTDFRPVFAHVATLDEPPKCLVYLTDLDGTFPREVPPYPVLWVIWGEHKEPPFGEVVKVL